MGSPTDIQVNQYLKQTSDLYGDELFLELNPRQLSEMGDDSLKKPFSDFSSDLLAFNQEINQCQKCALGRSRTNFVFGVGDPSASLILVGEAPGEKEDLKGEPFVGRAGKLLDKILAAINRSRENGLHVSTLQIYTPFSRERLMAARILSSNFPARPTKGSPFKSSFSPGASPTRIRDALGSPTPNTKLVRDRPRAHF
jgi:hypothetical protein